MEYYRRCNVCGNIACYTDQDLRNNNSQAMISGMAALGATVNAFAGTRYDMYEMNKISNNAGSKVVNYQKCNHCGSVDTFLVTKKFAQFANKNKYDENVLIDEASKYLSSSDFENAFCFANVACHEDESCYEGYLIKFLASYGINNIKDINKIKDDFSDNQHYINLYRCSDNTLRKLLSTICNNNKIRIAKEKAFELLKQDLDEVNLEDIKKICNLLQDAGLTDDADYIKINEYIKNRELRNKKAKSTTRKVLLVLGIVILFIIFICSELSNKKNYDEIMSLLEDNRYYYAMVNYYDKLSSSHKVKVNNYLLEKVAKYKWVSKVETNYTDGNDRMCLSKEYITFENTDSLITYIDCEDGYEDIENTFRNRRNIYIEKDTEDEMDNSVYKLELADGLYYLNFDINGYYITYESVYSNTGRKFSYAYSIVSE